MKNVTPGRAARTWLADMVAAKRAMLVQHERWARQRTRRGAFWCVSLTIVATFRVPVISTIAFWLAVLAGVATVGFWHEMRVARLQRGIEPEPPED